MNLDCIIIYKMRLASFWTPHEDNTEGKKDEMLRPGHVVYNETRLIARERLILTRYEVIYYVRATCEIYR